MDNNKNHEHLNSPPKEFPYPTYGFEKVISQDIDEEKLSERTREGLAGMGDEMWHEVQDALQTGISLRLLKNLNELPIFVNIEFIEKDGNASFSWSLNREVKPWVFEYLDQDDRPSGKPGSESYFQGETLTDGDSGLYSLVAAVIQKEEARGRLYGLMARGICFCLRELDTNTVARAIESIFLAPSRGESYPAVLPIVLAHGRTDLFPGYSLDLPHPYYTSDLLKEWAQLWQQRAEILENKVINQEGFDLDDIKMLEVFSHLFKIQPALASFDAWFTDIAKSSEAKAGNE